MEMAVWIMILYGYNNKKKLGPKQFVYAASTASKFS
jgi:hypothetical protein